MPKNLEKLQKKITKKKGNITSLNENSRDSQRLRRAGARGEKLGRLAVARAKANQPHSALRFSFSGSFRMMLTEAVQRVAFFQGAAKATDQPIQGQKIQSLIQRSVGCSKTSPLDCWN